ncbi:unnamed protein product [Ectocarpus fasciculatus]
MGAALGGSCGARTKEVVGSQFDGPLPSGEQPPELDAWIDHSTWPGLRSIVTEAYHNYSRERWSTFLGAGLLDAASEGNLAGVGQLLAAGAPRNSRDLEGHTPLHRASVAGHAGVAERLLSSGDGGSAPPLGGASPSSGRMVPEPPSLKWQASKEGPMLVPSVSLVKRSTLDARDHSGSRPIHLAAARGHAGVVQVLLHHGADVSGSNGVAQSPLHTAAAGLDSGDSVRLLLDAGGDLKARDSAGRTPLHVAASAGNTVVVSILVDGGADLEARGNISNRTPLHEACASLSAGSVQRLLHHGADERAVDIDDLTPENMICERMTEEEDATDPTIAPVGETICRMLADAPQDRLWRRRRLLPLLQWRQPPPAFDTEPGTTAVTVGAGSGQSIFELVVCQEEGIMRNIVSYL